jgi:excisionase family DNA binding protein
MTNTPQLLTIRDAASALRVSYATARKWVIDGRLPSIAFGQRTRRVPATRQVHRGEHDGRKLMSALEVLSYLTDTTFTTVVLLTIGTFAALQFINRIGGAR